ncbi:insulinase family protein [Campylobacter sp. faydin G-105]|uniref:M16 family metallopeptidase n=1 Tax=Campylobacter anatolicus TaxID=2829105 RepID=UPI001B94766D|nr:M16 family metallopeptidase [Campylobacter anatolicus]MBR8462386.1 insulinase family protein [Campylobacter anatolicus]
MRKFLLIIFTTISLFAKLNDDPSILQGTLENGLKYYVKQNALPSKTAYFYLVVNSGSTDEELNERGLAHFVEHMAFNGSRDFNKNELIKTLEALGVRFGADLNAQTGYDRTSYNLTIAVNDENLNDVFKVFNNWMDGVKFSPDELEKERGVIIEEARQRNTPGYRLYKKQTKQLFDGSIYLDKAPIGDMNVVLNVSADDIKAFYHRLYQPRFMSFVAVGDFDTQKIVKLIKQNLSSAKNTNFYEHPSKNIPFKNGLSIYNYDTNETGTNTIRISYFDRYEPRTNEKTARKNLINSYISSLLSALYERKSNEENSLFNVSFSRPNLQNQQTMYSFDTNVIKGDFNATLSDMLSVINGVSKYGFTESEFKDVKKSFINSTNTRFEQSKTKKSDTYAKEIVSSIESGNTILSNEDAKDLNLKLLDEISLEEINTEFKRILALNDMRVSVFSTSGYKLDVDKFRAFKNNATAYNGHTKPKVIAASLIDDNIKPKSIVSTEFDAKHQIYTYILENGAKVILKDLKTRKNYINFAAISKGGISNLAHPKDGGFATQVSNQSGAGEFNNYEIAKILNGKHISYQKNIDTLSQGYYGSSNTADLKYLFQAINLEFNSPRLDEKVLKLVQTRSLDNLAKNEKLPDYKFSTEFVKFYYNNNERTRPLEKGDITELNIDELKHIVNNKFTNAASYIFVLVGDLDMHIIEPLLQKYIATLPSKKELENFVDDGVRSIRGQHTFKRDYQTSQKSEVNINLINENAKYSRQNAIKAQALGAVLRMALREKVREDNGETYGFSLGINISKYPYEHSTLNIGFTCSPKNVDKILGEVWAIFDDIKANGAINKQHLQNYKKSALLSINKNYDQPDFWQRNIINHELYNYELFDLDEYKDMINSLSNDDITVAAKIYLDRSNQIVSINNPNDKK